MKNRDIQGKPWLGVMLALGWASAAPALAGVETEDVFMAEMPMVLTASRIEQSPLDAPAPVTVIDRATILASGFTEIHDLFRLVPGFLVAEWPEGSPIVVNHGLGDAHSRRMQVLVDGRSIFDPYWGGVAWQDLPVRVEDIERIEVVRAASQSVYGANAFQGVINIITREPSIDEGVNLMVSRGQRGYEDYYARFGRRQDNLDWRISLSTREMSGFEDRGVKPAYWGENVARDVMNARLNYRPDGQQEWNVQLGVSRGEDWAGTTIESDKYPFHRRGADSNFLQVGWRNSYAMGSEVSVQYYHYDRRETESYLESDSLTLPTDSIPVDFGLETRRDDIEIQQIHTFSPALRGVWGAGYRRDAARSDHYLYSLGTVEGDQWQVFGNLDWQAATDWLLHVGAMVEKHYLTDTLVSPRLAVNYTLAPNHVVRFSIGQGYRAPTMHEGYTREVFANPDGGIADVGDWAFLDLRPESVRFAEIGYVGRLPALGLSVDARVFSDKYKDYIDNQSCKLDLDLCPFGAPVGYARPSWFGNQKAFYFYNSGELHAFGGDLTLDWRNPVWGRIQYSVAYTQVIASGMADDDIEKSAPVHASSLLWSKTFPQGWTVSAGRYYVGHLKWPNDGDDQPSYERIDFKIAKRFGKADSRDEIALTLQNLNKRHVEFDEYQVERQAFLTLRLGW